MGAFRSRYPLPSKTLTAGGNAVIELNGLPDDARLAGIMLSITGTGTSSSDQAVTETDLASLLATVDLDSDFFFMRGTGILLHCLRHMMHGCKPSTVGTATSGGVSLRGVTMVPLADPSAANPLDTAVPCKLIKDKTLNLGFASSLVIDLTADVTMTNVTIQPTAILVPGNGAVLPSYSRIGFEDWAQATANLKAGHFTTLGIYEENLAVTLAEVSKLSVSMDSQPIIDRMETHQLVADFNYSKVKDAGSMLSHQPSASQEFIPVIYTGDKYKITQVPRAKNNVRADIDAGSQTSARWFYRQVVPASLAQEEDGMRKLGFDPSTTMVENKTVSGNEIQGSKPKSVNRKRRLLPKRLFRAGR